MKRTATLLRAKRVGGWVFNRFHNNKLLSKAIMINASQKKAIKIMRNKGYEVRGLHFKSRTIYHNR